MKPKLDLAKCELGCDFSVVSSLLSPNFVQLRYPAMESSESLYRDNKVTEMQTTSEKSIWQSSANGRDFSKLTFRDKDELNLQMQKYMVEQGFSNELIIENLEQCTEDHDCDRMSRGLGSENQCRDESVFEETERKLFLVGGMFRNDLDSKNDHLVPESDGKSYVEKEKGEKDGTEKDFYENKEVDKEISGNGIVKDVTDDRETDDNEKSENEKAEKEMIHKGNKECSSDKVKKFEYYSKADMAFDETVIDSGFFESGVIAESLEDGYLKLIDNNEVIMIQAIEEIEEGETVADPEQMEHELNQMEIKKLSALVLTMDSHPEVLDFDAEMSGNDLLIPTFLTVNSSFIGDSPSSIEEETCGSCMESDVLRQIELQKKVDGILTATEAELVPSDIQCIPWLQNFDNKWNNISNFTVTRRGPEPVNCERCCGRSGDRNDNTSQGNCGSGGGGGCSQDTACGGSRADSLSLVGSSSNGGSGSGCGGGDEDDDKWRKENFCFSDTTDKKKTKQAKELKKKSRLEKSDLAHHAVVSYGNKEKLREMALKWGRRSEHIRHNSAYARHHSEGVILDLYRDEFCITEDSYRENIDWTKATGRFNPLGCGTSGVWYLRFDADGSPQRCGTSGSCYPCADIKKGKAFCVKEIQLLNFYESEITILLDLDNPGIVKLYGAIFSDEKVYILQELICGPTLQEEIEKVGKFDCITALECTRQLLEILNYLENHGVIHDDVKADNIMLREGSNSVVLVDFGLAKKAPQVQQGTIPYGSQCGMSPEKAASEGYSAKADVWAAIAVLVHLLSGNMPWTIKEMSPPLEDVPTDTPEKIQSLIEIGWIVDPKRRPTASQLLTHEAFQLLDASLPTDELTTYNDNELTAYDDEYTTLENFSLEEGEKLIAEAELLISANIEKEIGEINCDHGESSDNLEGNDSGSIRLAWLNN